MKDKYKELRSLIYGNYGGYSISDKECEYIVEICKKIIKKEKKKLKGL